MEDVIEIYVIEIDEHIHDDEYGVRTDEYDDCSTSDRHSAYYTSPTQYHIHFAVIELPCMHGHHFLTEAEHGIGEADLIRFKTFFFFFQAEDGIRDADVTGVQTCALPIFREQIVSDLLSKGGDSGSLVVDEGRHAVGLLFAGGATTTLINPIAAVAHFLDIAID